jgi:hypothetical protein
VCISIGPTIWVGAIPAPHTTEDMLRGLLGRFGEIRRVYLRKKRAPAQSWALVTYSSSAAAQVALQAVRGSPLHYTPAPPRRVHC